MNNPMQNLNDLVFFAEVAERSSFTAAAVALGLPKSRLSHRVAQLEAALGVQLLQRSTRRLSLTSAGELYLRHCVAVRDAAQAAGEAMAQVRTEPRGTVRITCPVTLAQSTIGPLLPRFMQRFPEVNVDMRVLNRPVDPLEEGIDIALRVRPAIENSPTLAAKHFGVSRGLLVVSAEQLARQGPVLAPADLARLDTVAMSASAGQARLELIGPDGEPFTFLHRPRYVADDLAALKLAITEGIGAGMLPDYLCHAERQRGALVEALPGWALPPGIVHAMYPPRRALMPAVRCLLEFLGAHLEGDRVVFEPGSSESQALASDLPPG